MRHSSGILNMNFFLVFPWPHIKQAHIWNIHEVSFFLVTNLTVDFVGFLLLLSKIHAYVKNDFQYGGAKMATKSDMFVKYGPKVFH